MEQEKAAVDIEKIRQAIKSGIPITITTWTLPHEMGIYMEDVLRVFLNEVGQSQMVDNLAYCLKELTNNAKKANTKRVYFEDKGLDINDPDDYAEGMKNFKVETVNNIKYYLQQQRRRDMYIKFSLQTKNSKLKIEVRNKNELTVFEYKRIHDKITRGLQYETVAQGMNDLLDDSEGAGLGLVIMILVLRKIGLTEDNYQVLSENGETITRLILPFDAQTLETMNILSQKYVSLIDGLPEFPENIQKINNLISRPESTMGEIAQAISNDVSLTGELLKLVNSAAFALPTPCLSIPDAVKMVGIRGIRNLLFSIGSMKALMVDSNPRFRKMWDHAYQIAFYAYNMAHNFFTSPADKTNVEDSYVCGLLHDMGKIIFETAHKDVLKKINDMCKERGVSKDMFEKMVAGVNHGEVGALIAEKWNFPEVIVNVIRYHHDPESAPEESRRITALVNFADMAVHYSEGDIAFDQMDSEVLKVFKITTEAQLKKICDKLDQAYKNAQQKGS